MNSERKNYPMKEFRVIFPISSTLVNRSGYAKKDNFSILAVIQNIWDLHKFGLQIWIQNAKITLWNNFGQFFWFRRFWSSGPGINSKNMGFTKIWVADFNSECKNYPMKEFWAIFFYFIDFGHQVRVCKKRSHLNISCNSKNMGLT